jgi:ferredoxin
MRTKPGGKPPENVEIGEESRMRCVPVIDESACLAHGDCAELAPNVFRVGDVAEVIAEGDRDLLLEVAEACPAGAISVLDRETGEQIYP